MHESKFIFVIFTILSFSLAKQFFDTILFENQKKKSQVIGIQMNGERVPIKTTTVCIFNLTPPIPSRFLTSTPVCVTRNICFKIQNIPIGIRVYTRTDYIPHKRFNLSPVSNLVPYANVIVAYPEGGMKRTKNCAHSSFDAFEHHTWSEFPIILWIFKF